MKHGGYIAVVVVLTLLVVAALVYTIWAYRQRYPSESAAEQTTGKTEEIRTVEKANPLPSKDIEQFSKEVILAKKLEEEKDLLGAKKAYEGLLSVTSDTEKVYQELYRLNIKILFSPLPTVPPDGPKCRIHTVKGGDTVEAIARKYKTTEDLVMECNGITDPRSIQIGDRYKIVISEFRIVVSRSKNVLTLIAGDMVLKEYSVGTGEFKKTPLGDFFIEFKQKEPDWQGIPYGDKRNVLGTRWMGLKNEEDSIQGYGLHGTWDNSTIGKSVSQGCIRMTNENVEELYKIVPTKTSVKIID